MTKIRTTHTGSLHRPDDLKAMLIAHERGTQDPTLAAATTQVVADVVRDQVDLGIDIVNDGEMGRTGFATYLKDRLTGFDNEQVTKHHHRDLDAHPDYAEMLERTRPEYPRHPVCSGPIALKDPEAVHRDVANLIAAARAAGIGVDRLFMTAASPGVIANLFENQYYKSREEYLAALIEALRPEYQAIVDAGIILQLDCPDFAMSYNMIVHDVSYEEFRNELGLGVEALNAATEGLSPDRLRAHICWGNTGSPHTHDLALNDIIDLVLRARPAGIVLEASNPRHGHEWQLFETVILPDDKYLVPGVIDTTTNFVEHPELVAQRILNYARIVGPDRLIAGTDCGFGTVAVRDYVVRSVAWAKLRSLVEGAQLASSAY